MFRVSTFFILTLLLFSTIPISLAQQNTVQAEAEADASADISDESKVDWFLLGGVGSTMGCFFGCAAGSLLARVNPGYTSEFLSGTQLHFAFTGATLFGVFAVPAAVFVYPHNPTPPPERLLGKSPEYVAAYTHAYKSRTALLRKIFVTAGSIASNLGVMTTVLIVMSRFWS